MLFLSKEFSLSETITLLQEIIWFCGKLASVVTPEYDDGNLEQVGELRSSCLFHWV